MENKITVRLTPDKYEDQKSGKIRTLYLPLIEMFLVGNHKMGKSIRSYIDTGASFNIFPWEYATAFLGFSDRTLKQRGKLLPILGVGGFETEGYGYLCDIHHPEFRLENVYVYFVKGQPYPLLGLSGFIDRFERIIINTKEKKLELINPQK